MSRLGDSGVVRAGRRFSKREMMAEAVTATTALVAVGAAAAVLALVLLVVLVRSRRRGERRAAAGARARLRDEHAHGGHGARALGGARARAGRGSAQPLPRRAGRVDRPRRGARAHARGRRRDPGVDAAIVSIRDGADKPIVATLGLSAEEAQRQVISGPPNGHEARAISLVYQYPPALEGAELVHSGLAVPVPGESAAIGFIAIYSRSAEPPLRGGDDPRARGARQARRARRSRTRGASARRGSSPTSTR